MKKAIPLALLCMALPFIGRAQSISWEHVGPVTSRTYTLLMLFDGSILLSTDRGIFRSDDDGSSWVLVDSTLQGHNQFVQGSNGTILGKLTSVIASRDNGLTWSSLIDDQEPMHDVAVGHDGAYYYSMGHTFFCGGSSECTSLTGGLHKSIDQGVSWSKVAFPDTTVSDLVVAENGRLYAEVLLSEGSSIAYSDDGGASWNLHLMEGLAIWNLNRHPNGTLFAATSSGVRRFDEATHSLQHVGLSGDIWVVDISARGHLYAYTSTHEGFWSQDEGRTWEPLHLPEEALIWQDGFFSETPSGFLLYGSANGVYRSSAAIVVAVEENAPRPEQFATLGENFPNPFQISTTIPFSLDRPGHVRVEVINLLGEQVAVLMERIVPAGNHEVRWFPADTASGVYFYRLKSDYGLQTKLLTVIR